MICSQGDIIEVDFNPSVGHEPNKRRPALVISTDKFNLRSSLTAVVPITSVNNGYPLHVRIDGECVTGFACIEQVRTLDLSSRPCRKIETASEQTMGEALALVGAMFGI
ncbi:type II toxin-antitoxin system PemK/MazF family toxin [Adlercreutzia sp. ZJ242]|uniref:type II toxin-antitoxin system PemK/MazF family toxin n=1 Tax=Adlercreutzia sp. ZJ242 TaxID=2709409 RepID=UPI0013EA209C|nr:type II toxin-antitoxin system PemK/MazF family toxin [Adlercreutzia sp. ZJ242]